jgi:hypothetical protein
MSRQQGGYIGFNRVPAASALNSAASGMWTVREAESLRRAGTWPSAFTSPTSLAGLQLWLDAADPGVLFDATTGGSLVAADGGVARWEDKSGNARHATQGTAGSRPLRKTGIISGRDALRFDGSDDRLIVPTSAVNFGSSDFEIFLVGRGNASYNTFFTCVDASSGSAYILRMMVESARLQTTIRTTESGALDASGASSSYAAQSLVLFGLRRSSSTFTATRNGTSFGTVSNGAPMASTTQVAAIGAWVEGPPTAYYYHLTGDIAEVIIYNAALSDANRALVENYLLAKWSIT